MYAVPSRKPRAPMRAAVHCLGCAMVTRPTLQIPTHLNSLAVLIANLCTTGFRPLPAGQECLPCAEKIWTLGVVVRRIQGGETDDMTLDPLETMLGERARTRGAS
jgi:hypothetical protein